MKPRLFSQCLLGAALGVLSLPAYASKDEVQFGSTIHVPLDASIHDAVLSLLCAQYPYCIWSIYSCR